METEIKPTYRDAKMSRHQVLSVLMAAHFLPERATITKAKGTKQYVVTREIRLYKADGGLGRSITVEKGSVFLIPKHSPGEPISAIPSDTVVRWQVTADELQRWLRDATAEYRSDGQVTFDGIDFADVPDSIAKVISEQDLSTGEVLEAMYRYVLLSGQVHEDHFAAYLRSLGG